MSRKLSRNEMIFTPILILGFVAGAYVAGVHFGFSNSQIIKVIIPLSLLTTVVERFLNKNKKIDKKLLLNEQERKKDLKLIWAGVFFMIAFLIIALALHLIDYLSKNGQEISLSGLILILVAIPLALLACYLVMRAKINNSRI